MTNLMKPPVLSNKDVLKSSDIEYLKKIKANQELQQELIKGFLVFIRSFPEVDKRNQLCRAFYQALNEVMPSETTDND